MALIVDQDISDEAEYSFSPVAITSGLVNITTFGPTISVYGTGPTRRVYNVGYIAFGYNFTDARSNTESWYHEPIWIPSEHWVFTPYFLTSGVFAERVMWHLSPGTSGYLLLFS